MPFNQELASGQLSEQAFRHYMIQDAHYLLAFGRALAVAAAKADHADGVVQFADAAKNAVVVERSLHAVSYTHLAAVGGGDAVDALVDGVFVGDVHGHAHGLAAGLFDLAGDGVGAGLVQVGDGDGRAGARQGQRDVYKRQPKIRCAT